MKPRFFRTIIICYWNRRIVLFCGYSYFHYNRKQRLENSSTKFNFVNIVNFLKPMVMVLHKVKWGKRRCCCLGAKVLIAIKMRLLRIEPIAKLPFTLWVYCSSVILRFLIMGDENSTMKIDGIFSPSIDLNQASSLVIHPLIISIFGCKIEQKNIFCDTAALIDAICWSSL